MHEQRRAAVLEQLEQAAASVEPGRARECLGGQARPDETAIEQLVQVARIRIAHRRCCPGAELGRQGRRTFVPCVEQRPPGVRRERLDAERARERDIGAIDTVGPEEVHSTVGIVVGGLELTDADANGNRTDGTTLSCLLDSHDNIIVTDDPDHLIATVGLSSHIIVHTQDEAKCRDWTGERIFRVRHNSNLDTEAVGRLLDVVSRHIARCD